MIKLRDIADVELGSAFFDIYPTWTASPASIVLKQTLGSNASDAIEQVKEHLHDQGRSSCRRGWTR